MKNLAITVVLLFCTAVLSHGQDIVFDTPEKVLPIGKQIWFYEDPSGQLTLHDILHDSAQHIFTRSQHDRPNFANTTSAIWCRFSLINKTDEACLLQIEKSLIHYIDFYRPRTPGNAFDTVKVGALIPMDSREIRDNFFLFKLAKAHTLEPQTFYIRFRSDESLEIPMSIAVQEQLFIEHRSEEILFGFFYGLMLVMLAYNFFIYLIVKDKAYLYYAGYIISVLMLNDMMIGGLGFEFLWPQTPRVNYYINALTGLVGIFILLFSSNFLQTARVLPAWHKGLYPMYGLCILVMVGNFAGDYFYSSMGSQLTIFLISIYMLIVGAIAFTKGMRAARFYVIAWSMALGSALVYILFMNDVIAPSAWVDNAPLVGTALEVLLLSMALGDRINVLQRDRQQAQQEKLDLIATQNITLEKKITERTYEIAAQNEEIAAQNEELVTQQDQIHNQNEELLARNRELEKAQTVIHEQHTVLKRYSENLEDEISNRANQLVESNKELIAQNHQLEQFAFITAHNLRAPVARILGLAGIMQVCNEAEQKFVLKKIQESSEELDNVIRDLAKILEVRKGTGDKYEMVNLTEKLQRVKNLLQEEISKTNAAIIVQFDVSHVFSLPQYIESILYNLISNAIKYKSPRRAPEISIRTQPHGDYVQLIVSDNGSGVDLQKFKAKIFGLYQRFHLNIEGKGLGLHLVKTQVEALGGKIEIESELNEGTTFHIDIPIKK